MTSRPALGAALLLAVGVVSVPPAGAAAAAPSSTTLTLSTTTSAYGRTVTASAAVATSPGLPAGDVAFSVDGLALKANLLGNGTASLVLPAADVGVHSVTATFVPQDATTQQSSTSAVQQWTVAPVRTRLRVRVIGRGARVPTSVQVRAAGEYGSLPTGRVRVAVTRAGGRTTRARAQELSSDGVVRVPCGVLPRGSYRLVVSYAGDARHRAERRRQWFRVVRH